MSAVKPVKYDDANKKHAPFAEGDTLDPDAILIDPNSNNLLRSSDAGLMVELAAAPNVQNQYVSSSTGSDSNDGTEASPLKTIRYAVSRLPDNTSGTIYLKAGDVFKPEDGATGFVQNGTQAQIEAGTISVSNRSLSFAPYGDAQYDKIVATPGAVASQFDGVNQPIIVFTTCRASDTHFPGAPGFSWLSSTLEFNQIAVHITDPTGVLSAPQGAAGIGPFTVQSGTLRLNGNDMVLCNLAPVSAPVTSTASIAIVNALVDTTAGKAFATAVGYRISFEYSDSPKYPSSIPGSNWRGTNINAAIGTTASFPGVTIISADARTYEGLVTTNKITQA